MAARLAHTLHLLWELMHQQACLLANAPKSPASSSAECSFKAKERHKVTASGTLLGLGASIKALLSLAL